MTNNKIKIELQDIIKNELNAYIQSKYGSKVSQSDVGKLLALTRSAVANLTNAELPKQKAGNSRTSPVFYRVDDVVDCMITRTNKQKNKGGY